MEKKQFLRGALLLTFSGLVCKILGAVYRIPLSNTIGTEGMGYYQMAYPVYSLLIMLSTAGIPIALSQMISEECARGNLRAANEIFHVSRTMLIVLGCISSALLFFGSNFITALQGLPKTAFSLKMLSPSLLFVAMVSAYRGVLQGRQLMGATAVSQIVEQLVRLTLGLAIAAAWMPAGADMGAGGALFGVTLSELAGLCVVMGYYRAKRRAFGDCGIKVPTARKKLLLRRLLRVALPITLGACTTSLVSAIDSAVVLRVLTGNGYEAQHATALFGLLTGFVQPVLNMPAVLSSAVAMSIVPAISAACAVGNRSRMQHQANFAYKLGILLGLPCAVGLMLLAEPILAFLYPSLGAADLPAAAALLRTMAPGVLFLSVSQVSTGILQGIGKMLYPVCSMLLGAMVKLFLGIWLIRIPALNIHGAALSTLLYYAVNAAIDSLFVIRHAGVSSGLSHTLPRAALSAAGMGLAVYAVTHIFRGSLWGAVLAGAVIYAILLLGTGAFTAEDLLSIPHGDRLSSVLDQLKIWRKT